MEVPKLWSIDDPSLPDALLPSKAKETLPRLCHDDIHQAAKLGIARIGIVAAILDQQQRLLVLEHKESDKSPAGSLGPLAETAQLAETGSGVVVETTTHTLSRGIREELGVEKPQTLNIRAKRMGAWALNRWPVGVNYSHQAALAICPVVHLGPEEAERIMDEYEETAETTRVIFVPIGELRDIQNVRPGTHAWLDVIVKSNLIALSQHQRTGLMLPDPAPLPHAKDIRFDPPGLII